MRINFETAAKLIKDNDNFLILTHENPDGDTIGCAFAICRALQLLEKKAKVECFDKIPPMFEFIPESVEKQDFEEEFIIAVDLATLELLGDEDYIEKYRNKINLCIDHHSSNTLFAEYTLLEAEPVAAAAAETVLMLIGHLGVEIDEVIANCIYVGISTDTGCFRYFNTTSRSLRMAADMIDCGCDSGNINKIMFETKTKTYAALEKMALGTTEMHFGGKCAIITITREMFNESGSDDSECHPITAKPRQIEGVLVGATIREMKDGAFKISVRTNPPVNASEICAGMGGGGHMRAAGCELRCSYEEAKAILLENIKKILEM
ncbi:MAG: DHH family phosphoesterase [Oscillospiraceae bacterium]|nr:DHH family phosphoesterase [Oscillospiraceae bacterium]